MSNTIYRVMGKRGRITIPYEFRQQVGFGYNDILSFTKQDDNTVIVKREKGGSTKAIASVTLDSWYVVKGLRVVDGKKGLFVSMPQESYTDKGEKKYSNIFFPITNAAKMELQDAVLKAYDQHLDQ